MSQGNKMNRNENIQDVLKKRWITPVEFNLKYGIKINTQSKYRMDGRIPFSKVGKFIRYDTKKIDIWLEEHEVIS